MEQIIREAILKFSEHITDKLCMEGQLYPMSQNTKRASNCWVFAISVTITEFKANDSPQNHQKIFAVI